MTPPEAHAAAEARGSWTEAATRLWRSLPDKPVLAVLLVAWVALFHFLGNSTLGLVNTPSLFGWWRWTIGNSPDEEYAYFMPLVTLGLLAWRGRELAALPKAPSWAALGWVLLALVLHVLGYMVQQTRISVVAFVLGVYGLTGAVWGGAWLRATVFPFALLLFCVPLGSDIDRLTHPLRLLSTKITWGVSHYLLGIPVIGSGTRLISPDGRYLYDVAPACSGIRSLTAIIAFGIVFAFVSVRGGWRRLLIVASAIPLAIVGNVMRLVLIVLAAEMFGERAGNYVHTSGLFSLAPYVPAILGMLLLGRWLDEERPGRRPAPAPTGAAERGIPAASDAPAP